MIYLDNAATSFPKPQVVYDACDYWLRNQPAAFGRGLHSASQQATSVVESCRMELVGLLGLSSPRNLAFTLNATDSLNLLIRGLLSSESAIGGASTSGRADRAMCHVVATELDHNSVLRPLHELAERGVIQLSVVPFDPESGLIDESAFALALSRTPVRLVIINHASNVLGTVQHVRHLTAMAHQHGALVLLDAAQTAGHIPFSISEFDVDLLAAPGHKSLFGPLGTGFLWIRPGLEQQLQSLRTGGTGTHSELLLQPSTMPERFESGNLNLPGIAGLLAGVRWLKETTVETVHSRIAELAQRLTRSLSEIRGVKLWTPIDTVHSNNEASHSTGIVAFSVNGVESHDVAMILDQQAGIAARAGLHCAPLVHQRLGTLAGGGVVRISPGFFNTDSDIDQALNVIQTIAQSFAD